MWDDTQVRQSVATTLSIASDASLIQNSGSDSWQTRRDRTWAALFASRYTWRKVRALNHSRCTKISRIIGPSIDRSATLDCNFFITIKGSPLISTQRKPRSMTKRMTHLQEYAFSNKRVYYTSVWNDTCSHNLPHPVPS